MQVYATLCDDYFMPVRPVWVASMPTPTCHLLLTEAITETRGYDVVLNAKVPPTIFHNEMPSLATLLRHKGV